MSNISDTCNKRLNKYKNQQHSQKLQEKLNYRMFMKVKLTDKNN